MFSAVGFVDEKKPYLEWKRFGGVPHPISEGMVSAIRRRS
jgi:hypothetical protein